MRAYPLLTRSSMLRRLLRETVGQDLIEYLLLGSFLAIAGWGGVQFLGDSIASSYDRRDKAVQDLWETPEPIGP